uniref:Uncharacterized protein n=1 Tax=Chaetoceros debilis TaxID=122233 RepID=A0A7S3PU89_9STRA
MFGMSVCDIMCSVAMAATSLPMPKSLPDGANKSYTKPYEEWSGTKLGNIKTCEAQGFLFTFGATSMFSYNAMLCLYYACAIGLVMDERKIRKIVEPVLHGFPLAVGLSMSIPPLFQDNYNPSEWEAWCVPHPIICDMDAPGFPCIRGNFSAGNTHVVIILRASIAALFIIIVTSLMMVAVRVITTNRDFKMMAKIHEKMHPGNGLRKQGFSIETIREKNDTTRTVLIQAMVYLLAVTITLIFPIIQMLHLHAEGSLWPNYLELIFMPLQGFFNFAIFLYYKVGNFRRHNPDVTSLKVVRLFFTKKVEEPVLISRISIVHFDEEIRELQIGIHSDDQEEYLSYDLGSVASDEDKIDSIDLARVHEGLSFALETPSKNSSNLSGQNLSISDRISSRGGRNAFDELEACSEKIDSESSRAFVQNVLTTDGVSTSSRGGLSGFDELGSSFHKSDTSNTTWC